MGLDKWKSFHINPQEWNLSKILATVSPGSGEERSKDRVSRIACFLVLDRALTHCVTLGKSLSLSGPPFTHLNAVVIPRSHRGLSRHSWTETGTPGCLIPLAYSVTRTPNLLARINYGDDSGFFCWWLLTMNECVVTQLVGKMTSQSNPFDFWLLIM